MISKLITLLALTIAWLPLVASDTPADTVAGTATEDAPGELQPAAEPDTAHATPLSYEINFDVSFSAFGGDAIMKLVPADQPGEYDISVETRPRGMARMFIPKVSTERARFRFSEGEVISLNYELDDGTEAGENDTRITFDRDTGIASSLYEQEAVELPLGTDVYDRISADMVTMLDLRNGLEPRAFSIAEKNKIRAYEFTFDGEETITVPAGTFRTVRYDRQRIGSSRSVKIWYAADTEYLPVRIEQYKRGKRQVVMTAQSYALIR